MRVFTSNKKTDAREYPQGTRSHRFTLQQATRGPGVPFIKSSDEFHSSIGRRLCAAYAMRPAINVLYDTKLIVFVYCASRLCDLHGPSPSAIPRGGPEAPESR